MWSCTSLTSAVLGRYFDWWEQFAFDSSKFGLVFQIDLTTLWIELRQRVLCEMHSCRPPVLAGPTKDSVFIFVRGLFVTQGKRYREDGGSFRFSLCQIKTCTFDVFWCEDRRENNWTGDNHFPSKACWASVRWSTRIFPRSLFSFPNSVSLLTPTSSTGPGLTTGKREGGLFKRLSCKKLGKS